MNFRKQFKAMYTISSLSTFILLGTSAVSAAPVGGTWASLKGKGPVGIVSFSLNKQLNAVGEARSNGPGVMQSEEKFYATHKECLKISFKQFLDSLASVFPGTEFLPVEKIATNQAYQTYTKPNLKKILGKSVGIGADELNSDGLNYIQEEHAPYLDSLCDIVGTPVIMAVEIFASYDARNAIGGFGNGNMKFAYTIFVWEKGVGFLINDVITATSKETAPIAMGVMKEKYWSKQFISTQAQTFAEIRKLFLKRVAADYYTAP